MQPSDERSEFAHLDDPAFLAERARVRGLLEYQPDNSPGHAELERVFEAMTAEFLRRARIAWTPACPQCACPRADLPVLRTRVVRPSCIFNGQLSRRGK